MNMPNDLIERLETILSVNSGAFFESEEATIREVIAALRAGVGDRSALRCVVDAWEATKSGETSVSEIQRWLVDDMKPAIDRARSALSQPAQSRNEIVQLCMDAVRACIFCMTAEDRSVAPILDAEMMSVLAALKDGGRTNG